MLGSRRKRNTGGFLRARSFCGLSCSPEKRIGLQSIVFGENNRPEDWVTNFVADHGNPFLVNSDVSSQLRILFGWTIWDVFKLY